MADEGQRSSVTLRSLARSAEGQAAAAAAALWAAAAAGAAAAALRVVGGVAADAAAAGLGSVAGEVAVARVAEAVVAERSGRTHGSLVASAEAPFDTQT